MQQYIICTCLQRVRPVVVSTPLGAMPYVHSSLDSMVPVAAHAPSLGAYMGAVQLRSTRYSTAAKVDRPPGKDTQQAADQGTAASATTKPDEGQGTASISFNSIIANVASIYSRLGPVSLADVVFGLQVLEHKHTSMRVTPASPSTPLPPAAAQKRAQALLEDLDLAAGVYKNNASRMCAVTRLKLRNVKHYQSEGWSLSPGNFIAVCHVAREVVWSVRGTNNMTDLIMDLCGAPHPYPPYGYTHWGMHQAAETLLKKKGQLVKELLQTEARGYTLKLVGHSLGAGVAALMAHMILTKAECVGRLVGPGAASSVVATCFATPAVMDIQLAESLKDTVTSVVMDEDIVPRLSSESIAALLDELTTLKVDWSKEAQKLLDAKSMLETAAKLAIPSAFFPPPKDDAGIQLPEQLATSTPTNQPTSWYIPPPPEALRQLAETLLSSEYARKWSKGAEDSGGKGGEGEVHLPEQLATSTPTNKHTSWYIPPSPEALRQLAETLLPREYARQWSKGAEGSGGKGGEGEETGSTGTRASGKGSGTGNNGAQSPTEAWDRLSSIVLPKQDSSEQGLGGGAGPKTSDKSTSDGESTIFLSLPWQKNQVAFQPAAQAFGPLNPRIVLGPRALTDHRWGSYRHSLEAIVRGGQEQCCEQQEKEEENSGGRGEGGEAGGEAGGGGFDGFDR
eukprot:gene8210-1473_t